MSSIALIDCNNFFVSCERLFNPQLIGKPVVVLSSNDGCIVSRSNEAKALQIPMGAPFFQWEDYLQRHHVHVLSSNFSLYGDMSKRVMETLMYFHGDVEIYSVDEAFLLLQGEKNPVAFCRFLRKKVLQWTGITTSIGIARTKTLAKLASERAKKNLAFKGVCELFSEEKIEEMLKNISPQEIWGIGRKTNDYLSKKGIKTALQFRNQDDLFLSKNLSVHALRTALELRGVPCFGFDDAPRVKQSILNSRSFEHPITSKEALKEVVAHFVTKGAEDLRGNEELNVAGFLQVFIMTSRHREGFYSNCSQRVFEEPTNYTPHLIKAALEGVERIFKPGLEYKRAGVLLSHFSSDKSVQTDLFVRQDEMSRRKHEEAMKLLDAVNGHFGTRILKFAAEGVRSNSSARSSLRSPCFTTSWEELLSVLVR